MKKMSCLFERDFCGKRPVLLPKVTLGCEWVLRGEGVASRKWDGTACAVIGDMLYKRYDAKRDPKTKEYRVPPTGAVPCCDPDPTTGHWPHWLSVGDEPESKHHLLAWSMTPQLADGTYELIGPPIGGNHERVAALEFKRHGDVALDLRDLWPSSCVVGDVFEVLKGVLQSLPWEGLVFAHADGRRCKIRRDDFGWPWPLPVASVAGAQ